MRLMKKKKAFKIVYNELVNQCHLFTGMYDARNGDDKFMYGIETVMEVIASKVSDRTWDEFLDMFTNNMIFCESLAEGKKRRTKPTVKNKTRKRKFIK